MLTNMPSPHKPARKAPPKNDTAASVCEAAASSACSAV
jgi:hypothetical protein